MFASKKQQFRALCKDPRTKHLLSLLAVVGSGFLQAFTLKVFIAPAQLLSSGFLGISILVNKIGALFGADISISLLMLLLNIPVALLCYRGISPRFTFYSIIQVICGSFFIHVLHFEPFINDIMLNVIFGGVFNGLYVSLALKGNASTGGLDFVALFISNKSGRTIWKQIFLFNTILLVIFGALFGWEYAGYSIVFQYISTKVISTFHRRYQRVTLLMTTRKPQEVMAAYTKQVHHGISCLEAEGGYSHEKTYLLHAVLSSYEVLDAIDCVYKVDPAIIINQLTTDNFYGRFYREPE
ncbi:Uncharacterized membrane-anchored protein YitT, contains DUF161 and DUF2179 domains [Granulicatella balaenopterae]|uniref:Uncharacterized membrane-anchored protein YitT, contains DUF161 and DUF2179 domains n=1 Tax=Granulicatella balaenopterae TaxID=137733 RepID=A0A1H9NQT2_9LACT|nr:YitT family protein [Granulicatella balaenopterae]SER37693.1 Uncharacterized membrane-anchored protein YitT, contains DUF161 and DUF2179 domains [Granulicatella balaenopterae]